MIAALERIAAHLGTTTEYLMSVMRGQLYVEIVAGLVLLAGFSVAFFYGWRFLRNRWADMGDGEQDLIDLEKSVRKESDS